MLGMVNGTRKRQIENTLDQHHQARYQHETEKKLIKKMERMERDGWQSVSGELTMTEPMK